jgi:hypothetical protein
MHTDTQLPATVSAPRGNIVPEQYSVNYTWSVDAPFKAVQNPRKSQPEIIQSDHWRLFPQSPAEKPLTSDELSVPGREHYGQPEVGRSIGRSGSSERGKPYHEDRHRGAQVVTTFSTTRRPAPVRSSSTPQSSMSVPEGKKVETSTDPASCLSRLGQMFIRIEHGKYGACQDFIDNHPKILEEELSNFQLEARRLEREGKFSMVRTCVQQLLLLRKCSSMSVANSDIFFNRLRNEDPETLKSFITDFDKTLKALKAPAGPLQHGRKPEPESLRSTGRGPSQVPAEIRHASETTRRGSVASDLPLASLSIGSHHGQDQSGSHGQAGNTLNLPPVTYQTAVGRRPTLGSVDEDPRPDIQSDTNSQAGDVSIVDAAQLDIRGNGEEREELDHRYQKRTDAKKFFVVGRVFAMLWHEGAGDKKGGHLSQAERFNVGRYNKKKGKYNEEVYSHIRRMVVVKQRHGYCWCVPINTYNYQGVAKKGLSSDDREAHSIIYMDNAKPAIHSTEKGMMFKSPIAVTAVNSEQKLHYMSRINFGKVYSVEWNVKVMHVGKVNAESMAAFTGYWHNEAMRT